MSNYLDVYVRDNLKRIPGVADVHHLRRAQVLHAPLARSRTYGRPLPYRRRCGQRPRGTERRSRRRTSRLTAGLPGQQFQISVRAVGRLSEASSIRRHHPEEQCRWHSRPPAGRRPCRLGAEDYSNDLDYNGHESVGIGVTQLSTANALDVASRASPNSIAFPSVSRPA